MDFMDHSVETTVSGDAAAARSAYHASVAHFTRIGNWRTPASTDSFPTSPTGLSIEEVTMRWKRSNSALTSSTVLPLTTSVISDADAFEIAQPDPSKDASTIRFWESTREHTAR